MPCAALSLPNPLGLFSYTGTSKKLRHRWQSAASPILMVIGDDDRAAQTKLISCAGIDLACCGSRSVKRQASAMRDFPITVSLWS